ncbi:MAG: hypothetical protein NTZ20_00175 [Candidatus Levybacteria bacterium]|nr:hypothetical protein [Candidatus Levybacteria bacterium]MSU25769.1 hypothetical protein [Candidatus Levybacteria bacterium]
MKNKKRYYFFLSSILSLVLLLLLIFFHTPDSSFYFNKVNFYLPTEFCFFILSFIFVLCFSTSILLFVRRGVVWGIFSTMSLFLLMERLYHPLFFILLFILSLIIDGLIKKPE